MIHVGVVRGQLFTLLSELMVGMRRVGIAYEKALTAESMAWLLKHRRAPAPPPPSLVAARTTAVGPSPSFGPTACIDEARDSTRA